MIEPACFFNYPKAFRQGPEVRRPIGVIENIKHQSVQDYGGTIRLSAETV